MSKNEMNESNELTMIEKVWDAVKTISVLVYTKVKVTLTSQKFWMGTLIFLWFLGIIAPFIGLGIIQALLWAAPAGWGIGLILVQWTLGEFDKIKD